MLIVPERAGIARVRLLVDFLAEQIGGIPGIEKPRPGAFLRPPHHMWTRFMPGPKPSARSGETDAEMSVNGTNEPEFAAPQVRQMNPSLHLFTCCAGRSSTSEVAMDDSLAVFWIWIAAVVLFAVAVAVAC